MCAWGVSFDKNAGTFTIFQDTKSGAGASCPGNLQYTPTEEFETFTLDSRVKIQCIGTTSSAGGACVPKPNLDVIFTPPDPTVDFTPYLKTVGAIVTNEGGITSHAAIMSREFQIPCIVGTHEATKIFKDGDLVEVDANTGIVRLLTN